MNSIHQFIVKPIGERYNNEITIGGKKLIVNSSISDHKFVNREAEIVATPLAYKTKLKKGDRVITMPVGSERIFIVKDSTVRSGSNYTIGVQNVGATTGIIPLNPGSTTAYYTDGTTANSMKLLGVLNKGSVTVTNGVNSPYTAIAGDIIFGDVGNSGGGPITVTLPSDPVAGDEVTIMDGTGSGGFASNNCTVGRNLEPIQGAASDFVMATNNQSVTFIYIDATKGWQLKSTNT